MTRGTPHDDWVAYVIVLAVTAAMMLGKYLMAKGDEPIGDVIKNDLKKDFEELEHDIEDIVHDVEEKLK